MHEQALFSRRRIATALPLATIAGTFPAAATALVAPVAADHVLAQIELHKVLKARVDTHPGDDDDPDFRAACAAEEAAIQALGDMMPTTIAGAAAQLQHMADVEGTFATSGSPLLRTVLSVAAALNEIGGLHA